MVRCSIFGCPSTARVEYPSQDGPVQVCGDHAPETEGQKMAVSRKSEVESE